MLTIESTLKKIYSLLSIPMTSSENKQFRGAVSGKCGRQLSWFFRPSKFYPFKTICYEHGGGIYDVRTKVMSEAGLLEF